MVWKASHKEESRQKILTAAADLFTRKGFNRVGIDDVMAAAGMTRGAFYAHFSSKFELYEEAILKAGRAAMQHFEENSASSEDLIKNYLSEEHLLSDDIRCPLACLVSDVAHDDVRVKQTYTKIFKGFLKNLQEKPESGNEESAVLLKAVLMIGGMALARSLTDKQLAKKILETCSEAAMVPEREGSNY